MVPAQKRVTSYDIAKASGVSQATVSYVLNRVEGQKISDATRERVLAAAAELNYRPYGPARTLSLGHSRTVMFVLPSFPLGHAMNELLANLTSRLSHKGLKLLTYRPEPNESVLQIASDLSPYGIISLVPLSPDQHRSLEQQGIAVEVMALSTPAGEDADLTNPQERNGQMQIEYLLSKGHTRIGAAMPNDERLRPFSEPRLAGIDQALEERSLDAAVVRVLHGDVDQAVHAVRNWVELGITAVAAYNDDVAVEVLAGARRAGVRVPDQLAVIGLDDTPIARQIDPTLTSVFTDMDHLAARLVHHLVGETKPLRVKNNTHVVPRESA
ncbi:LacI family DNA-binding transcriptional regulator [Microbacterium trichothecenolyticum]|uniref:LacI family DNA-binding transcriptional regulator n=1 Tax=Microbacterium trichothecenolyticum TaxID=69370 RepID=UPI001C6E7F04|nr:LacI family DNA-binding transcriptional regulator [Microbacterium trichothecenolyticum]MBW9122330.1 LacI family DNA-binding transcriptional regulator [Microbacterium trichothecenolyticum]